MNILRVFDLLIAISGIIVLWPILIALTIAGFFDTGKPIFVQQRVGKNRSLFNLVKFRSMKIETQSVATHLAMASDVTKYGRFLRATKLDELPQLFNVLFGQMSIVGPRPGLPDHLDLIEARAKFGVFDVRPGITGLAQVMGVDMSMPNTLAQIDAKMLSDMSVLNYLRYILLTVQGAGRGDRLKPDS